MPAACALGMNSGKIILIEQCRAVCGPPGIAFSQMELGRQGADAAPASYGSGGAAGEELALSASLRSAALPKGEPLAWRHSFRLNCKVCGFARASPFGRGGIASAMTERASPLPGGAFRPKFHVLGRKLQTIKQSAQKGGAKFGGDAFDRS